MSKLEINMRMYVKGPDKDGSDEILMRVMYIKFKELLQIASRGNLDSEATFTRPTKKRRSSDRGLKLRRNK